MQLGRPGSSASSGTIDVSQDDGCGLGRVGSGHDDKRRSRHEQS